MNFMPIWRQSKRIWLPTLRCSMSSFSRTRSDLSIHSYMCSPLHQLLETTQEGLSC